MDNDKAGIALKYLELARADIGKGYFINQTLGAYLLCSHRGSTNPHISP
jgi:hypothetical protein